MQAFDLDPQAAIAGRISRIVTFGDDALERHGAGLFMGRAAMPDLLIAILQGRVRIRQECSKPRLPFNQRPRAQIFAVEMEKIEKEESEHRGIAPVGCRLDHAE